MKKKQTKSIWVFQNTYPIQDLHALWQKHVDTLEELINQHIPDCRERLEYCCNKLNEEERLIGFRSSFGNLLGTLECYSKGLKSKEVFLFIHPDQWGTGLDDRLLSEGKKIWSLDYKRDTIYFFGC